MNAWEGAVAEVLIFDANRGVVTRRQWWRPWRKVVVEWRGSQRSMAAQNWIVENYLADKWGIDLYVRPEPASGSVTQWNDRAAGGTEHET